MLNWAIVDDPAATLYFLSLKKIVGGHIPVMMSKLHEVFKRIRL